MWRLELLELYVKYFISLKFNIQQQNKYNTVITNIIYKYIKNYLIFSNRQAKIYINKSKINKYINKKIKRTCIHKTDPNK